MSHERTDCVVISAQLYIFFTIYHVITTLFFYHTFFVILLFCLSNEKLLLSDANVCPEGIECFFQILILDSVEMKSEVPII
jgi:hypothetical protein